MHAKKSVYTDSLAFIRGNFSAAGTRIPYFLVSMPVAKALQYLRVAREVLFEPEEIDIEELFQRDLDDVRVEHEIAPYLQREGEVKFFNSVVVVLVPIKGRQILPGYSGPASTEGSETGPVVEVGGVRVVSCGELQGALSWDPERVAAIVVDGQHRFAAMRHVGAHQFGESCLPVVFLVFHESLGFECPHSTILGVVRRIFVDLNRQARKVSETRNILLDDRDPVGMAVRALLESQVTSEERRDVGSRLLRGRLPLALVDWYSDNVKFDHGIHVTTVMALYQVLGSFFQLPAKVDPCDYDRSEKLVGRLDELALIPGLRSHLDRCSDSELPFFLERSHIEHFRNWFRSTWGAAVAYVLTHCEPYFSLVSKLEDLGFLGGVLETWAAVDNHGKKAFVASHSLDSAEILRQVEQIERWKSGDLAFQVVFQKGIVRAFLEMATQALRGYSLSRTGALPEGSPRPTPLEFARVWVSRYNERVCTRDKVFWEGAGRTTTGHLSPTKQSENAIVGCLVTVLMLPVDEWLSDSAEIDERLLCDGMAQELYFDTKFKHPLIGMKRVRRIYGGAWRSSIRKFLGERENAGGAALGSGVAEVKAIDSHISCRLQAALGRARGHCRPGGICRFGGLEGFASGAEAQAWLCSNGSQ